jgi:hypothetical protein
MTVVNISDYSKDQKFDEDFEGPMCITFYSAKFVDQSGTDRVVNITITVDDGDVFAVLDSIKADGGVGAIRHGVYQFVPWPCACMAIHQPGVDPFAIQ